MTSEQLATQASSVDVAAGDGDEDRRRGGGAQVAPLPLASVHAGKIMGDAAASVLPPPHEDEQSYIPVAMARLHLERVVADMRAMKEEQAARVAMLVERYKSMEAETTRQYEERVKDLKAKARAKFEREQLKLATLKQQGEAERQQAEQRVEGMRVEAEESERQRAQERERSREELETAMAQQEEALARLLQRMQKEVAEAVEAEAGTLGSLHRLEVDKLHAQCAEAAADVTRLGEELQRVRSQLGEREARYTAELQRLKEEQALEGEVGLCLAAVVNRVVDMAEATRRRRRSRELKTEIERLGTLVAAAERREDALGEQLRQLEDEYRRMVEGTVAQTVEVVANAVASRERREIQERVSTWAQTTAVERRDAAVATTPPKASVDQPPPSTLRPASPTVAAATEPTSTEPTASVPEAAVPAAPAPVLPGSSTVVVEEEGVDPRTATQLQVAVDAERFKERNAALLRSKAQLKETKAALETATNRKNEAKASIKRWLSEFQREHGRDPSIDEKALVKDLYLAFKETEDAVSAARDSLASAKTQHQQLVREVELLSQWQALAVTAARGASRGRSQEGERGAIGGAREESGASVAESLAAVAALEGEIEGLRAELARATAERTQAEDAAAAAKMEAKEAMTQSREMQAKLAGSRPSTAEVVARAESKAENKGESKGEEDVASAVEAKALRQEAESLRVAIAGLRDEVALRAAEKQTLEMKIEQLRLHAELVDEGREELLRSHAKEEEKGEELSKEEEGEEGVIDKHQEAEEEEEAGDDDLVADAKGSSNEYAGEQQLMSQIREAIEAGKTQWNKGDKAKCFQLYVRACERSIEVLRVSHKEEAASIKSALQEASRLAPAKGSMVLRRALDTCLAACEGRASPSRSSTASSSPQRKTRKSVAVDGLGEASSPKKHTDGGDAGGGGRALEEARQKLKALEAKAKADKVKITQLESALSKAEAQLATAVASGGAGGGGGGAATVLLERKLAEAEKRHAKALEDADRAMKKEVAALTQQLTASQARTKSLDEQVDALTKELAVAGGRASQLGKLETEVAELRGRAAQADALAAELSASRGELATLTTSYKEEQALRKKYYNQIEDMKGKIRVYARCRPMSGSEVERGCGSAVRFVDEFSLELQTSHGPKTFAFDQVFPPLSSQEQVFEDTKNLVQSAVDGYNVCIFAYGQTGSGKTHTMTGSEALPGLTPRTIHHLFALAAANSGNHAVTFHATMLELYNDTLVDLLLLVDGGGGGGGGGDPPKLEIKKNERGMVTVANATVRKCTSAAQTLKLFELANKKRQVGATKMNAESSRSHSVFSLLIENVNKTTKATSLGKLSLVDLAGSERAGKTGATAERLKEAQAINKSLSALGDVIAALSSGEKFIPYRNNKLTQLMQDSLGGNAKTLMFVNISPADYNQEETQTSLQYASRVKLITNSANKASESETVTRLKAVIKQLRAGKADVDLDGLALD